MHYRNFGGVGKCSIFKYSKNQKLQQAYYRNKEVEEFLSLIVGASGSGKSMLTMNICYTLWKQGYVIIFVTEKPGDEMNFAYCHFPPERDYHLERLDLMGLAQETIPPKLYHPFTFNIPAGKLPPINFFTLPIKGVDEDAFAALLTGDVDAQTVRLCADISSRLAKKDDIHDFLHTMRQRVSDPESLASLEISPKDAYTGIGSVGDSKSIKKVGLAMSLFRDDFFLQSAESPTNLDFVDVINDQEHFHVFSTKWISERRVKFFTYINVLRGIEKALESGKANYKVCLVLEEIRVLLPKTADVSYENKLADQFVRMLNTIRSKGRGVNVIATTQDYAETNVQFRTSLNRRILCRVGVDDRKRLQNDFGFSPDKIELIKSLDKGEYVIWESLEDDEQQSAKYLSDVTPFMHSEAEYNLFEKWRKYHPEEMTDTRSLMTSMLKVRDVAEKKAIDKLREDLKEKAVESVLKQNRGRGRPRKVAESVELEEKAEEVKELKSAIKEQRSSVRSEVARNVYEGKIKEPTTSWSELGKRNNISGMLSKIYAIDYARSVKDDDFIKRWKAA